jgi:plastocyanin
VRWELQGTAIGHTVIDNGGAFNSGMVFNAAGDSFSHTFGMADAGRTFEYRCVTHQGCCQMLAAARNRA